MAVPQFTVRHLAGSLLAIGVGFTGYRRFNAHAHAEQFEQPSRVRRQGMVFTFGSNEFGQLGVETPGQALATPTRVEGQLKNLDVRQIAVGADHVLALEAGGSVFSWGRSQYQTLGFQSDTVVDAPVRITALSRVPIRQVAASDTNSYAVDVDGRLWSWGRSKALGRSVGQFGSDSSALSQGAWIPEPLPLLKDVRQVAAGHGFALALTSAGQLFSWGDNSRGALGLGGRDDRDVPTLVGSLPRAADDRLMGITAGSQFALVLSQTGRLWFFGGSDFGQAGSMATRYQREPVEVHGISNDGQGDQVVDVAAGRYHCAAVTKSGHVWAWGLGTDGQIGSGTRQTHNPTPVQVPEDFGGSKVVKVACGGAHTAAITEDGRLYCWGRGRESQLGQADSLTSVAAAAVLPQEVSWFRQNGFVVRDIALGNNFTCVLAEPAEL